MFHGFSCLPLNSVHGEEFYAESHSSICTHLVLVLVHSAVFQLQEFLIISLSGVVQVSFRGRRHCSKDGKSQDPKT